MSDGTYIAKSARGSSNQQLDNRNLFCSERLRDAELNAENGGEDGGPAFHSKQVTTAGRPEWPASKL